MSLPCRPPLLPGLPRALLALLAPGGWWLATLLLIICTPAGAASYDIPNNMPPGCSGSNGIYSCQGGGALGSTDTITLSGTKPATVTINGSLNINGARLNQAGSASDLTLVVNGVLTPGFQSVINAHVRAYSVSDGNGASTFGGNLRATQGNISLAYQATVVGDVTADSGTVALADEVVVNGNVTASGHVQTAYRTRIGGAVVAGDDSSIGQETTVGGAITVSGGNNIDIGYGAIVSGNISSGSGTISLAQNAAARACVQVVDGSDPINLGTQVSVAAVCCGAVGSCSSSCVNNNSGSAMPALCTTANTTATLLARYNFDEGAYSGASGELKDNAGHSSGPFNGRAQGSALPGSASTSPARSGNPGTCAYATLPGPFANGGGFKITGLPVLTTAGAQTSVSFWMYWDGADSTMPLGWQAYNLIFLSGGFGFNTSNSDLYGVASTGLANGWHHVVAVFTNGGVTGNKLWIDGVAQTLSQRRGTPLSNGAVVGGQLQASGWGSDTGYRFSGRIDQLRVYKGAVTTTQASTLHTETSACGTVEVARYDFNEASYNGTAGEWKDTAGYSGGPYNGRGQGAGMPTAASTTPARSGSPGTCSYASLAGPAGDGPSLVASGLPTTTTAGAATTVAFWVRWSGADDGIVLSFGEYDLWFNGGSFGFNTNNADIHGISSSGMAGVWKHVVAVFVNGNATSSLLYIDGVLQTLSQRMGSPNNAKALTSTTLQVSGYTADTWHRFSGLVDSLRVYSGAASATQVATLYAETPSTCVPPLHHLAIEHASGTGLTCTPSTITIKACQNADCTSLYTGGVTGTLSATGGSVVWPDGASFSITAGSSSTTRRLQATTTTATVLGTSGSAPAASSATSCNFGNPSCSFTAADAGFIFDVVNHVSDLVQTVSVSAVRKSDNSTVCTPAFASSSKAVSFSCGYTNPNSGSLPVRVGGTALNAGSNSAAACDANGSAVTLAFNASGVASTTVQYADVGQMLLSARYAGAAGGSEAGLVMTGSDSFITAPDHFSIDNITAGPIRAGSAFSATVTARNALGNTTPNHGRETSAQRALIGWVMRQPTGTGAVPGSFSGTGFRSFTNGAVTASDLAWTEVGRGDLVVRGSDNAGYFGTGLHVFGSSLASGARTCAAEGGNCVLPGGTTATVYYGAPGGWTAKGGQTGTVACNNGNFGDPIPGTAKRCYYAASAASNGSVGDFIPHRFTVAASNACGAFSYAGQPITTTVTAQNAAGNTTRNFNGTATTTPGFAQAVTLADANNLGLGTLSGNSIAASAFSAGVATATPSYAFTSKTTAPQSLVLRASNGAAGAALVSSQGHAEPTLPLRSGRLRLSNAFGKATAALQLAAATDYWAGSAWLLNSADSCTTLAANSVALSNPRSATGAVSTATSSAGALAISSGSGSISLAAPSPAGSSLSLDLAVNLGSGGSDQSCQTNHPATTGAAKPWLRAANGSCAATTDRDPAARATFGIFSPETRKTVHVRDIY